MSADLITSEHPVFATCGIFSIERDYGGFGDRICTFSVALRDGKKAWMKISLRYDSDKWVVVVRRRPFLDAWARSRQERQLSTGDEAAWRDDYKFHYAEKGFWHGRDNPVQLAWCGAHYELDRGLPVLHTCFTDGITRISGCWPMAPKAFLSALAQKKAPVFFSGALATERLGPSQ